MGRLKYSLLNPPPSSSAALTHRIPLSYLINIARGVHSAYFSQFLVLLNDWCRGIEVCLNSALKKNHAGLEGSWNSNTSNSKQVQTNLYKCCACVCMLNKLHRLNVQQEQRGFSDLDFTFFPSFLCYRLCARFSYPYLNISECRPACKGRGDHKHCTTKSQECSVSKSDRC